MALVEVIIPVLGEGVVDAMLQNWLKKVGDTVKEDEVIAELATDKVDSELPSPASGVITKILYNSGTVIEVGKAIAIIDTGGDEEIMTTEKVHRMVENTTPLTSNQNIKRETQPVFLSPLVRSIAHKEGILIDELKTVKGSGNAGRLVKDDLLAYISNRTLNENGNTNSSTQMIAPISAFNEPFAPKTQTKEGIIPGEHIKMDRVRKLIAENMLRSVQTSPHVTSITEVDLTNVVRWREKVKREFEKIRGTKLTYTHIFIEVVAKALREFPMLNSSVSGESIILHKEINVGVATALPDGNLIVPVVKNADQLNLVGMAKTVNDLVVKARIKKLSPNDIRGGTFSLTNLGNFGTLIGTPIINQPEVAILALGTIVKRPIVIESDAGDFIGIRNMVYLSLSYDHRIIDGALAGQFMARIQLLLQEFDVNRVI